MSRAEAFSSLSPIFTSLWPLKPSSSLASSAMVHSPLSISSRERVNEKEGSSRFSLTILPLTLRLAETTLSSASLISPVITSVPGFVTIAPSEGEVIWHAGAVFIFSDSLERERFHVLRCQAFAILDFYRNGIRTHRERFCRNFVFERKGCNARDYLCPYGKRNF